MAGSYHHGNLREALVTAGVSILGRDGAEAVTLRAVAREAGVSHAAPYSHFRDRDDLLAAVAVPGLRELTGRLRSAVVTCEGDGPDRIRAFGRAYVEFAIERPDAYRLVFDSGLASPGLDEVSDLAFAILRRAVEAGQASGSVARGPSAGLATFAWASLHGLATLFVDRRLDIDEGPIRDRLVSYLTGLVLDGIRKRET
ncbi:MAG: TetR/AcrR family transcriptional regulator [Planctomycetota bacterium]